MDMTHTQKNQNNMSWFAINNKTNLKTDEIMYLKLEI